MLGYTFEISKYTVYIRFKITFLLTIKETTSTILGSLFFSKFFRFPPATLQKNIAGAIQIIFLYWLLTTTFACVNPLDFVVMVIGPVSPGFERTMTKANPLKALR